MPDEVIGKYKVHPLATMFPLIEGDEFDALKKDIKDAGQRLPIIVQGDVLLDGRNRLRACLELNVVPKIEEYRGVKPVHLIYTQNIVRRHLNEDQRILVEAAIFEPMRAESDAIRRKLKGKSADGNAGGRGRKNLETNSSPGLAKTAAKDARSTVGQLAKQAETSHHKAAQALAVHKHAPELTDQIVAGKMKLKDAAKAARQAKEQKSPKPPIARNSENEFWAAIEMENAFAVNRRIGELREYISEVCDERLAQKGEVYARNVVHEIMEENSVVVEFIAALVVHIMDERRGLGSCNVGLERQWNVQKKKTAKSDAD